MSFVQSTFLAAFAALAIPVIVHLMFRMRTRRVDLGTVRFLREVLHKNARRKKIKRLTLLALRMVCFSLLALLFARPYFLAQELGSADRLVTLLIDRSASMELRSEGRRLLDLAAERANAIIQESGSQTRIELAFFDHDVRPLGSEDADARPWNGRVVAPDTAHGATDYGAALGWARDVSVKAGPAHKELHILTDLQRSGLDWSEVAAMPEDVRVTIHDLGRDGTSNVAITAAELNRTLLRPGEAATLHVAVSNASPFPLKEATLRLFLRSQRLTHSLERQVTVPAGGLEQFEFRLEGLADGLWQGQVEIETEDDLAFDNRRFLALMSAPPWKVLVVDGQPHSSPVLSETYFLHAALRLATSNDPLAYTPYEPKVISADALTEASLNDYEIVVLANVEQVSGAAARRLADFVADGKGLVVFSGDQVQAAGYEAMRRAGLTPGQLGDFQSAHDLPWRLDDWDQQHSILAPFNDPQHGDLRRLAFQAYTRIVPSEPTRVLATFRGGDPALLEIDAGKGHVLWFASSCDRQWGDWPRSRLYLPLVHQMLGHLTGLNAGGPVRDLSIDASSRLPVDTAPGVFQRERHWQVVNISPRESETDRCTAAEFAERFGLRTEGSSAASAASASVIPASLELRDDEFWHWLALALVAVLCFECLLANRTTS